MLQAVDVAPDLQASTLVVSNSRQASFDVPRAKEAMDTDEPVAQVCRTVA